MDNPLLQKNAKFHLKISYGVPRNRQKTKLISLGYDDNDHTNSKSVKLRRTDLASSWTDLYKILDQTFN